MSVLIDDLALGLKTYRAPWKGQIVLVCRKCEKKLKHSGEKSGLAKLQKVLKKRNKRNKSAEPLRVIGVSCLKMCPKGGVTVCTQQQLGRNECCILRTREDVDALMCQTSLQGDAFYAHKAH